jgi:hypothetical protein
VLVGLDAHPSALAHLGDEARRVAPGERVEHQVAGLGQKVHKELDELHRHSGRMLRYVVFPAVSLIRVAC